MILRGTITENDQLITLYLNKGKISRIEPFQKEPGLNSEENDLYIASGFFDLQVNGFAGIDFNSKNLIPEEVYQAARTLLTFGVTTFFPTLITAPFEKLVHQLKILSEAIETIPLLSEMCPGIHLEGPYISPTEGPRGIHPLQFIRPPRWDEFEKFQEVCSGKIKLITLAPEVDGVLGFIKKVVSSGVVVAIGHTEASELILDAACEAGATLSTHLGNGMGNYFPRYRNPFQKQLSMDGLMASIITDGIHLPDYVIKNIVKAKGAEKIILATDAMAGADQPPGQYGFADLEVEVEENGRTKWGKTGALAGSTLTIPKAITNVVKFTGTDLRTAIHMAGQNGRKLFPEMVRTIAPGQPADLVLFRFKDGVVIERTLLMGEEILPIPNTKYQITNTKL